MRPEKPRSGLPVKPRGSRQVQQSTAEHRLVGGPWWGRGIVRLGLALFKGLFGLVSRGVRTSWPYSEGVRLARNHRQVEEALGNPIEVGWLFSGSFGVAGQSGSARLVVPLMGPNGRGTLYVLAKKAEGQWEFELAEVEVSNRANRINLLPECIDVGSETCRTLPPTVAGDD